MEKYWWISFSSTSPEQEWDTFNFFEQGACGVEENGFPTQNLDALPLASYVELKGFFQEAEAFSRGLKFFEDKKGLTSGVEDVRDWDQSWRLQQKPVQVSQRLWVMPPWLEADKVGMEFVIKLEARMAFGTGSHESTKIAIHLMERGIPTGKRVLDIGAGTGILAMYAMLLGSGPALALEIDPVAAPSLKDNRDMNPTQNGAQIHAIIGSMEILQPEARFELILCNMIRSELWPFRRQLFEKLYPAGIFIVSGQLAKDRPIFKAFEAEGGWRMREEEQIGEWWGFTGQKTE